MYPRLMGHIKTYDVMNNLGTIAGILAFFYVFYKKNTDKRQLVGNFLLALVLIQLGSKLSGAVRAINDNDLQGIKATWEMAWSGKEGTHFIGRVLFTAWCYPLGNRLLHVIFGKLWNIEPDRRATEDALAFYFVIQHIFNRIACFCNGCCYGNFYNGFGAMQFAGLNAPVFPTQLFECVLMIGILFYLIRRWRAGKALLGVMFVLFGSAIFLSEFLMSNVGINKYFGLTMIQFCAVMLGCTGLIYIYAQQKKKKEK